MDELNWLTISEAVDLLSTRRVSAVELLDACIEQIRRLEPRLHCFIAPTFDQAMAAARDADAHPEDARERSLLGVPIGVKDIFDTAGILTTAGSRIFNERVPDTDSTAVARLRRAGAVIIGKLNTHEFALGGTTDNPHWGRTHNPWDLERIPGGSSGGSAAAVAAGYAPAALGSDTGSSVRGPAACCGVTGLKPTFGRISRFGVFPLSASMDHVGPITRSAEDCALLLQVLAGFDPADPASVDAPVDNYVGTLQDSVASKAIGVVEASFLDAIDPDVASAVDVALHELQNHGARLTSRDLTQIFPDRTPAYNVMLAEAAAYHDTWLSERPDDYGADVRDRLREGQAVSAVDYLHGLEAQRRMRQAVVDAMQGIDLLALPTLLIPAPRFGQVEVFLNGKSYDPSSTTRQCTWPFSFTGLPAMAIPCGFSRDGVPVSLQIVARPFDESTLLSVGYAFQRTTDWHARRPPLAT